jgi:hypothetical protein
MPPFAQTARASASESISPAGELLGAGVGLSSALGAGLVLAGAEGEGLTVGLPQAARRTSNSVIAT